MSKPIIYKYGHRIKVWDLDRNLEIIKISIVFIAMILELSN